MNLNRDYKGINMKSVKKDTLSIFKRLIDALDRMSEIDLSKLYDESYDVEIRLIKRKSKEENLVFEEVDLKSLVRIITDLPSREDAEVFLIENYSTRKLIEPIARYLDIPSSKQDKIEVLRNKIIETTVGARIRSQTIRSVSDRSV